MQDQIVDVQAGDDYTCLLTNQGYVYCWGGNQDGELADNQKVAWSDSPALIPLATSVDSLQVDDETACAVSMGTINCWGNGSSGIFYQSTGNNDNANSPVVLGAASALFGGSNAETFCFQTPAAQVQCWGSNSSGQAAIGSLSPINVDAPKTALIPPVTQLGIGQDHGCALTKAGQVFCWGGNMLGELGNGKTSMTPNPVPAPVKLTCASGS
jgi:alpha-tubulin suppressor-like RCC1 family protein